MTLATPPFKPGQLVLSPLPYPYDALAPVLSERQVSAHYNEHHAQYVRKANEILAAAGGPAGLVRAPARVCDKWDFNSRGAWLHDLFWHSLVPGGSDPSPFLVEHLGGPGALMRLRADLLQAGLDVRGSGWVVLSHFGDGELRVHVEQNHDYAAAEEGGHPVLVLDLWEHAYYLDYTAQKQAYLESLLGLVHWAMVEHRLLGRQGLPS